MDGGCLCGAIRYRVSAPPFDADFCHCRICQKSTGSVLPSWMDFKHEEVTWTLAQPVEYSSSEHVRRGFCAQCGSSLSFRDTRYPQYLSLSIASLDDPNLVRPRYHIFTDSQVNWLSIDDDCERYPQARQSKVDPS